MSTGPFLYDDDPAPIHTGRPRNRDRSIVVLLVLTALLAVGTVVGIYVFRGSPADEAEERVAVFVAALAADDVAVASAILCEEERLGGTAEQALEPYRDLSGTVGEAREATADEAGDGPALVVPVDSGGGTTELLLVPEGGPKVCGVLAG